mgnify:CR=1 FL=1
MSKIIRTDEELNAIWSKAVSVRPEDPTYPVAYTVLTMLMWLVGRQRTESLWLLLNGVQDPKDGQ